MTSSLSSTGQSIVSDGSKEDAATPPVACTAACTSKPGIANETPLEAIAAALLNLPAADRAKLLALLQSAGPDLQPKADE